CARNTSPSARSTSLRSPPFFSIASQRVFAQARNIDRARPRGRPAEAPLAFLDGDIVDAGLAPAHQAVLVELPLLVAVGAMPLPGIVMPFILEAHRDAVLIERPEILDQAIVMLLRPFAGEECDDRFAALKEFGAVTPAAILGIGQRHPDRIARIPGVFRHARLLGGGFAGEGRQRRTRHDVSPGWRPRDIVPIGTESQLARINPEPDRPSSTAAAISGLAALCPRR